jgi:hypothetical protein
MSTTFQKIKQLIPVSMRRALLKVHQQYVFAGALRELQVMVDNNRSDAPVLKKLIYGWGNQGYSAQTDYLETCVEYAYKTDNAILECGTGLSTIVIGMIAKKRGLPLQSFEHHKEWGAKVEAMTRKLGLNNVTINVNPLKDYGPYCWYDTLGANISSNIGMVICDGPPAQTKGGRYGLIPQIKSSLHAGAVILMDDTSRQDERSVIEKWRNSLDFEVVEKGEHDPHAILVIK